MEYVVGTLVFVGAVGGAFVVVRRIARGAFGSSRRLEAELGLDALRHRLEKGEITQAEYEAATRAIRGG